jgi:hypothetical protein
VARRPHFTLPRFETLPFVIRGAAGYSFRRSEEDFHGCYLTITASKQFQLSAELVERFRSDPDGAGVLDQVAEAVGDLRGDLRQVAIQAATVCAVELAPAVLEPWLEFDTFWPTHETQRSHYGTGVSEILDERVAIDSEVLALGETVVLAGLDSPYTRAVQLAGSWYLKGRSEPAASTERFVGLFQCLEALTNCAPQDPDPQLHEWFASVALLLAKTDSDDRAALEQMLGLIKQRVARPILSERFRRLLDTLALVEKEERQRKFDAMNKLRNDLLHAHISFVPGHYRGLDVDRTITELAREMLTAVVKRMVADAKDRGHTVGFTYSRDAV